MTETITQTPVETTTPPPVEQNELPVEQNELPKVEKRNKPGRNERELARLARQNEQLNAKIDGLVATLSGKPVSEEDAKAQEEGLKQLEALELKRFQQEYKQNEENYKENLEELQDKYDDLDDAIETLGYYSERLYDTAVNVMLRSPLSGEIAYYLGNNRDELIALSSMGENGQIKYMSKLETKVKKQLDTATPQTANGKGGVNLNPIGKNTPVSKPAATPVEVDETTKKFREEKAKYGFFL